jgi:enolase
VTAIADVLGWEALDSRGTPTVGCEITLAGGASGSAVVPSGASTGAYEAHELRDGGSRYGGRGVQRAVAAVNGEIRGALIGLDAAGQEALDAALRRLDGTPDLSRLGANAVLAASIAACRAAAAGAGVELHRHVAADPSSPPLLPLPMVNVISGGAHAARALDVQDLLVMPVGAASFAEGIEWCWRVRTATAQVAAERGLPVALVADEGGLGLPLRSNREAVELLERGLERSGLAAGEQVAIAIDVAASQLYRDGAYELALEGRRLDAGGLVDELLGWARDHPIVSFEDPLADEDWDGWTLAADRLVAQVQVIGDDLFATNLARLERGIAAGCANAILVKPNQIGTLSDARAALRRAQEAGMATILSGRSGDTEDTWLSDLAVGWRAGQVKIGSTTRSERTGKWNRLLQIEARAGGASAFAGRAPAVAFRWREL